MVKVEKFQLVCTIGPKVLGGTCPFETFLELRKAKVALGKQGNICQDPGLTVTARVEKCPPNAFKSTLALTEARLLFNSSSKCQKQTVPGVLTRRY